MTEELDVLKIISDPLETAGIPFMLTGSFALGHYGTLWMTRDFNFVVALIVQQVDKVADVPVN